MKRIFYFFIVSITLVLLLPLYNMYTQLQHIETKNLFNSDVIEKYVNYTVYQLFNRSLDENQVITGKEGYLFLGNKYADVLHKTNGVNRPELSQIHSWTNKLKELQSWYKETGIKTAVILAPNKHTVYQDKLPNWMQYKGLTISDDLIASANNVSANILDLRKTFHDARESSNQPLYFKYGTHWNNLGASIAYEKTMELFNNEGSSLKKTHYQLKPYQSKFDRALLKFLKIEDLVSDSDIDFSYGFKNSIKIAEIDNSTLNLGSIKNKKISPIFPNKKSYYILNENAANSCDALLIGDSYLGAISSLYINTFKKTYFFHSEHLYGDRLSRFIDLYHPQYVIYQKVERELYNHKMVIKPTTIYNTKLTENHSENPILSLNQLSANATYNNIHLLKSKSGLSFEALSNDPMLIIKNINTNSDRVTLVYELDSPIDTVFQIFNKLDKNHRYKLSLTTKIHKGNNRYILSIPSKFLSNGLRFDLVSKVGIYHINTFSIYQSP